MVNQIKMQGKKAQIAETMTWIVAFIIIFFIMFLFVGGVGILRGSDVIKTGSYQNRNTLEITNGEVEASKIDLETLKEIKDFSDQSKTSLSNWADNEETRKVSEKEIKSIFEGYPFSVNTVEKLFRKIEFSSGDNKFTIGPSPNSARLRGARNTVKEEPIKFFILSDNGNIVEVMYSEG